MPKIPEERPKIINLGNVSRAGITESPDQPYKAIASTDVPSLTPSIPLVVRSKHETLGRREAEMFLDGLARAYLEQARLLVIGDVPDLQQPDASAPCPPEDE